MTETNRRIESGLDGSVDDDPRKVLAAIEIIEGAHRRRRRKDDDESLS